MEWELYHELLRNILKQNAFSGWRLWNRKYIMNYSVGGILNIYEIFHKNTLYGESLGLENISRSISKIHFMESVVFSKSYHEVLTKCIFWRASWTGKYIMNY